MGIHRFRSVLILAASALILSFSINAGLSVHAADKEGTDDNDYVAIVNGTKIPSEDLERKVEMIKARYAGSGAQMAEQQLAELRQAVLENLIEQQLLYQSSKDEGIEVGSDEIQTELDEVKDQFESEEQYQDQIARMNYSEKTLKKEIERNLAIRKLIDKKFASEVSVTEEDIESFYNKNKEEFEVPEKVRARHILIKSGPDDSDEKKSEAKEKIEEVQGKLEDGEEFSELAKEYSEDPSAESGGDLGYFTKGQMVKRFDEAAFSLEPGEVSDIVESRFGYHLIKLEDRKEESVQPLDEVGDSIRENLEREKIMQELEPYIESLKDEYEIERNLPEAG